MTDREALIEAMARAMALADDEDYMEDYRRYDKRATAALSAIEAMGAIVVPVEATAEMAKAALNADLDIYWAYSADGRPDDPRDVYAAMIASSPFAKGSTDDK